MAIVLTAIFGCSTGLKIQLKDASGTNVGNIVFEEQSWPVFSMASGPTATVWLRKDFTNMAVHVEGEAAYTNKTSALGIYDGTDSKWLKISVDAKVKDAK